MSAPYNPNIDLQVARGHGLHLQINGQPVPDSYGAIVMAELSHLCQSPAVRWCAPVAAALGEPGVIEHAL